MATQTALTNAQHYQEISVLYTNNGWDRIHLVTDKEEMPLWITATSAKGNERIQL